MSLSFLLPDYYDLYLLCEDLHLKMLYFRLFSIPERCQGCPYCRYNCCYLIQVRSALGINNYCRLDCNIKESCPDPCLECKSRGECGSCPAA